MLTQRFFMMTRLLAALVVSLGATLPCRAHGGGGHGGGAGHVLAHGGFPAYGFRGGFGYRGFYGYPGFYYGFPGFYGLGLGFGLGYGLGYGYGYGYGYPYYGYGGGYPVYVSPGYAAPPAAGPVAGQGGAPAATATPVPAGPIRLTDSDVILSIRVPPDALVRINGTRTNQNGPRREFLSSGLAPGRTYTFDVTAQWINPNGQVEQHEQRVQVQGGERRNVDFLMPPPTARVLR
jgi:uncharacterized protein (TIGR03000 family)